MGGGGGETLKKKEGYIFRGSYYGWGVGVLKSIGGRGGISMAILMRIF